MKVLKGHTKIELTNVKTGEVKVIEDENLVTNAMSKLFEQTPYCGFGVSSNPFTSKNQLIDRLCGGILLFSEPIDEDPDNYLIPKGNKMVGNGRINYASAQNVPEFGAFNAEESSWSISNRERKYVYDFSTSKGNGTISCVALTNFLLGYYGVGNASDKSERLTVENVNYSYYNLMTKYFWNNSLSFSSSYSSDVGVPADGRILFADYNKNNVIVFDNYSLNYNSTYTSQHISNGYLPIYKVYFPMTSVDPFQRLISEGAWRIMEKVDIEVPSEIASISKKYTQYSCICRAKDALYIVFSGTSSREVSANAKFYMWKISHDLETSEVYTLTNTTGVSINVGYRGEVSSSHYSRGMAVVDGYLVCQGSGKIFKMNLSDPTDVVEFTLSWTSTNAQWCFYELGNTLFASEAYYSDTYVMVVDVSTCEGHWTNGCPSISTGEAKNNAKYTHVIPVVGCDNFLISSNDEYLASSSSKLVYNPVMLSTINNLPEPVVKTSDLAMKITYTLTLADDEQEAGDS